MKATTANSTTCSAPRASELPFSSCVSSASGFPSTALFVADLPPPFRLLPASFPIIAQTSATMATTNDAINMPLFQSPVAISDVFCFTMAITMDAITATMIPTAAVLVPKRSELARAYAYTSPTSNAVTARSSTTFTK